MKYTSERCNGIKSGFWSPHSKEAVVQKLGAIEKDVPVLIEKICDDYCQFRASAADEESLQEQHCNACPVTRLRDLAV